MERAIGRINLDDNKVFYTVVVGFILVLVFGASYFYWQATRPFTCSQEITAQESYRFGDCIEGVIVSKEPYLQLKIQAIKNSLKTKNKAWTSTQHKVGDMVTIAYEDIKETSRGKIETMQVGDSIVGFLLAAQCPDVLEARYCELFTLASDRVISN